MTLPISGGETPKGLVSFYDKCAATHDENARKIGWVLSTSTMLGEALDRLPWAPNSVLDLAAGTGLSTGTLLEHCNPSQLLAVDFSSAMLARLKSKYGEDGRVNTLDMGVEQYLAKTEEKFDLIVAIGLLHLMEEQKLSIILDGVGRRLQPEGRFLATYNPVVRFSQENEATRTDYGHGEVVYRYYPDKFEAMVASSGLLRVTRQLLFSPQPQGNPAMVSTFFEAERI